MRLYLIQHGEASASDVDPERSLTDGGREDVKNIAEFLKDAGVKVSRVIHSGKLRAQQTAEILFEAMGEDASFDTSTIINPTDPVEPFSQEIRELTTDTMVVGHLPFMARLVGLFVGGNPDRVITTYRPGSIVCLEREGTGEWSIAWMLRPELFSY
jgi:phosphohistidine phosphatase